MNAVIGGLIIFIIIYLTVALINYIYLYITKDSWNPEFEEGMKSFAFRFLLFVYGPIAVSRRFLEK